MGQSTLDAAKQWVGLDVDLCRAIAAAVLGTATKVKFVPLTAQQRFTALESGTVDVLVRNTTVSLQRTVGTKLQFAAINYYDGLAFVVSQALRIDRLNGLMNKTICVMKGTTHEFKMNA